MFKRRNLFLAIQRYLAGMLIYSLAMLLYVKSSYYHRFLSRDTLVALKYLYSAYVIAGLPWLLWHQPKTHKAIQLIEALSQFLRVFRNFTTSHPHHKKNSPPLLSPENKNHLLLMLVKIFYIPIMLNFFFANSRSTISLFQKYFAAENFHFNFRLDYVSLFSIIFMIDTAFFVFGYLVEHPRLKNVIKSVEPTALGWAVALASYPPFNSISGGYLNWYSSDYFTFLDPAVDWGMKIAAVLLLCLYLWATLSLGTRCSNLTSRGVVTGGAYKYIRHPAYTGKVLFWWISALPRLSIGMVLSLVGWTLIYYLRAATEERHLITSDSEYRKYTKLTPFRFLPGLI